MKYRAYLDFETTGLSRYYSDLTIIGQKLVANDQELRTTDNTETSAASLSARTDCHNIRIHSTFLTNMRAVEWIDRFA
jgi:hypothetical protein